MGRAAARGEMSGAEEDVARAAIRCPRTQRPAPDHAPRGVPRYLTPTAIRDLSWDRNRAAILGFEFLWGLAIPFVHFSTILPGYLRHLEVANAWIGLAPALYNGAQALWQPLSAYAMPPGSRRLQRMRRIYVSGACGWMALGLWILSGARSPEFGLLAALLATLGFATATGFGDPQYMALIVAAVPPRHRGRFFGLRIVCLGLGGIVGGALAARLLRASAAPASFGFCFLAGGLLYIISTCSMLFYRERETAGTETRAGFRSFVAERILPRVRQPAFRAYLVATVFFALAASGFPFLGLLLRERMGETDRLFGLLGSLLMGGNLVMSWGLGVVCDRWGSRRGFALTLITYAAGVLGCLLFHDRTALLACYLLAGTWMPGLFVAVTDLALRLAADAPAAEVSAVMMAAMAPARILGPVLVGAAIDRWSYAPALLGCVACALLALVALGRRRHEPRLTMAPADP